MNTTIGALKQQLAAVRTNRLFDLLLAAAATHQLPLAYVLAIGSRETNLKNILGDFRDGEYHGVGILQIDVQHSLARSARNDGSWQSHPEPLIEFGTAMLAENIAAAALHFPSFDAHQHQKIAASGYNCGLQRAIDGAHHGDSDLHTTGHDYGKDVMGRMALFEGLLMEGNHALPV